VALALLDAAPIAGTLGAELVMRLRPGVNLDAGDPNHDLFQAALALAARGGALRFAFGDEPILGGGTRLAGDRFSAPATGRGVVASVAVNLPRIALLARRDHQAFDSQLTQVLDLAGRHLAYRMHVLAQLRARDLPQLMLGGLYAGAGDLAPTDPLGFALRHGQLNVAFVGLAEALTLMEGEHHGEASASQQRGLAMVRLMRDQVEAMAERHDLNMVLSGQAAPEAASRFALLDRRDFGSLPGVTDRAAYSASFLLPVDFPTSPERRIAREADYHRLCPGGNGLLWGGDSQDAAALEGLIRRMHSEGAGLLGFGPAPVAAEA
jgi:ribonucleoside-triphosphate reductase